jgi:NAD(P)H-dependent flavin oxidoreductase YrpB (nitropropane dioxygenase family)
MGAGLPRDLPDLTADTHEKVRHLFSLGASAVQIGTRFAVTEEGPMV